MLLTAEEMGLAAMWRTGDGAYDPQVKQWLGLAPEDHIVAFVYLGFPLIPKLERHPTPNEEKTTWLGWGERCSSASTQQQRSKVLQASLFCHWHHVHLL